MKVYVAIIRGPNAAMGMVKGGSSRPKTKTMETKHGIHHTTPGAIATSTVLVRFDYHHLDKIAHIQIEGALGFIRRRMPSRTRCYYRHTLYEQL